MVTMIHFKVRSSLCRRTLHITSRKKDVKCVVVEILDERGQYKENISRKVIFINE